MGCCRPEAGEGQVGGHAPKQCIIRGFDAPNWKPRAAAERVVAFGAMRTWKVMSGMQVNGDALKSWIEDELATVSDERVTSHIRRLLVEPYLVLRPWDYGEPGQQYPCWTVLDDSPNSSTGIAYCASGFGPKCPWGLVWLGDEGTESRAPMGMDPAWYPTFMGAFFESFGATALPIWRVFKEQSDRVRVPITEEGEWDATWQRRDVIQASDPVSRYHCDHSISVGR